MRLRIGYTWLTYKHVLCGDEKGLSIKVFNLYTTRNLSTLSGIRVCSILSRSVGFFLMRWLVDYVTRDLFCWNISPSRRRDEFALRVWSFIAICDVTAIYQPGFDVGAGMAGVVQ